MMFNALTESSRILHESVAGMTEEDAARQPGPEMWSARDCVEHLVMAEGGLRGRITAVEPAATAEEAPAVRSRAVEALANRSVKMEAPQRAHPAGRFATLAEALEAFDSARQDTIRFVEEHQDNLPRRTVVHPLFGSLSGVDMIFVIAGHTRRHADQIKEMRLGAHRT